jgi:hypothetical protein
MTGSINVGVSPDGVDFPPAKTIAMDKDTRYGPAVAIFGKYLVVTYQTTNRDIAPLDAPPGAYVAWLESTDGGKTWSSPEALFGRDVKSLPTFTTQIKDSKGKMLPRSIRLAGIPDKLTSFGQVLNWEAPTISQSRVFVTTAMSYESPDGQGETRTLGVVSFKLPQKGGQWTHVVANSMSTAVVNDGWEPNGIYHQYSALPGTPLRVVSYVNRSGVADGESLVAAISTDNAQHFVRIVRYKAADLGFSKDAHIALRASLCLWRDSDGSVSLDTFLTSGATDNDRLVHAKIPLGIRLKGGEVVSASNW